MSIRAEITFKWKDYSKKFNELQDFEDTYLAKKQGDKIRVIAPNNNLFIVGYDELNTLMVLFEQYLNFNGVECFASIMLEGNEVITSTNYLKILKILFLYQGKTTYEEELHI
jgi:hypothetical protein